MEKNIKKNYMDNSELAKHSRNQNLKRNEEGVIQKQYQKRCLRISGQEMKPQVQKVLQIQYAKSVKKLN